ncbi:hypothetical protein V1290_001104 [Bradyrhizobium sp. AZCC 1578]|uniref:hypothetical protein n=1 Tax=Bradyrhizobium sp. AZCC 1578 TaxID=3117027 RepID=UPI002FF01ED2
MSDSAHSEPLIDRIYEAGLIPSLWPAVLGELSAAIGGNGGFLFGVARWLHERGQFCRI